MFSASLDTTAFLTSNPTNLPLLKALHTNSQIDIKEIFTDLDASVGGINIAKALSMSFTTSTSVLINKATWPIFYRAMTEIETSIGAVLTEPLEAIHTSFQRLESRSSSEANTTIWQEILTHTSEIQTWASGFQRDIQVRIAGLAESLQHSQRRDIEEPVIQKAINLIAPIKTHLHKLHETTQLIRPQEEVVERISTLSDTLVEGHEIFKSSAARVDKLIQKLIPEANQRIHAAISELAKLIKLETQNIQSFTRKNRRMRSISKKFAPFTHFRAFFDTDKIRTCLEAPLKTLFDRFQAPETSTDFSFSKSLLLDTKKYLSVVDTLVSIPGLEREFQIGDDVKIDAPRLGGCILGLLNSGVDVLLTGTAGSGKSTTLEMFAKQRYENRSPGTEVIFLPLAKVASPGELSEPNDPLEHLFMEIARLFQGSMPGVTPRFVEDKVVNAKELILIIDGVDEANALLQWLPSVIDGLKNKLGNSMQVVASSRFDVPQLLRLGLINIHLLPFEPNQVIRFINGFLQNESTLAKNVIDHLKSHKSMFSVVQTPLMATILCALAGNGVALPETRGALYRERFKLLWGAYDTKKQINRVKSSTSCLEDVSKKAAYYLHHKGRRSDNSEDILNYASRALSQKYRVDIIKAAYEELLQPCNVLVEEIDGTIGFGHLSYQEYLVAEELYTSRSSEIVSHLDDAWWREVLVLIAMKADDIGSLIEQRIIHLGSIADSEATLRAMINVTNASQRKILNNLLRAHLRLDNAIDGLDGDRELSGSDYLYDPW